MSSLRNAVKRVTHKERGQVSDRKKLGLLEKHKDYIERAKDYKNKQNYLKALRKKASEKNPDEFYYHMHKSQVQGGVHREINNKTLDKETVDLLKTQDLGYLMHKKTIEDNKVQRLLEQQQGGIVLTKPKNHTIFLDNADEMETFDPAEHFQTHPKLLERTYNRPKKEQLTQMIENGTLEKIIEDDQDKKKRKRKNPEFKELQERIKRSKKITSAIDELSLQRNLSSSKGKRQKIILKKEVGKEKKEKEVTIFKWKRERTR